MRTCSLRLSFFAVVVACGAGLRAADTDAGTSIAAAPRAPTTQSAADQDVADDIAISIDRLGDNDPVVRDAASRKLGSLGKAALPALRQAANGDDPEVASRARHLLAELRFGIDPRTPPALLNLVSEYRASQDQSRNQAIDAMSRLGWPGYRVLARLRRQEADPAWRAVLARPLQIGAPGILGVARAMIVAGQESAAEARLAEAAVGGDELVVRSYVALAWARGRIDQIIGELRIETGETPGVEDALLLALLYRAKGDGGNALRYARQVRALPGMIGEGELLVREILLDRRDWAALVADATRQADAASPLRALALAEKLTYARLGGDAKAFDEALAGIRAMTEQSPQLLPACANTLILNDRADEGINMLVKAKACATAYRMMAAQGRYADAAKLLTDARSESAPDLAVLELAAARTLASLGDNEQATEIVDRIEKQIAANPSNPTTGDLISTELALGRTDTACQLAVAAMATATPTDAILSRIAPRAGRNAQAWRDWLAGRDPKATPAETLHKVWALYARKLPAAETEALLRGAADEAAGQKPSDRPAIYARAADTARLVGRPDLADEFFEKLAADLDADASKGWYPFKHLGDWAAAKKNFRRAAECYERGERPGEPICLWLHGWAMTRAAAGDPDKLAVAKGEMRRADEMLLADDEAWLRFLDAIAIVDADSIADGEEQRRLMRRLVRPGSRGISESYGYSARAMLSQSKDPAEEEIIDAIAAPRVDGPGYLEAAHLTSLRLMGVARGESAFVRPEGYLDEPALQHVVWAHGLIATGDVAAAMKEADLCLELLPANLHSELPIDLVPVLDRQGHKQEADALFNKVAAGLDASVARYPKCAQLHNDVAWIRAECDRDLDKALEHARQATELAPDTVGYLDTLAQVQFRRGDRQAAIDTMKHCIDLDPHYEYLRNQMKRFTGERPSP